VAGKACDSGASRAVAGGATGVRMMHPVWEEIPDAQNGYIHDYSDHLVMIYEACEILTGQIAKGMERGRCLSFKSEESQLDLQFQTCAATVFKEIKKILKQRDLHKMLIQVLVPVHKQNQEQKVLLSGLAGVLRTAEKENPALTCQLIEIEPDNFKEPEALLQIIRRSRNLSATLQDPHIRYQSGDTSVLGKISVLKWRELKPSKATAATPWREGGVYLITGGLGGLGVIFAEEILRSVVSAKVILAGRSSLSLDKADKLSRLDPTGARVLYRQADMADRDSVYGLIESILHDFNTLDGIIHSAGMIMDNFMIKKTPEEFLTVLSPKVSGAWNLDMATSALALDFFVLFSSLSGVAGNPGQADYACANAFLDQFARYRDEMAASGERSGKSLSLNWPLWRDGGMHLAGDTAESHSESGIIPLQRSTGIRAFYQSLSANPCQVMVLEGELKVIDALFTPQPLKEKGGKEKAERSLDRDDSRMEIKLTEPQLLHTETARYFRRLLASFLKLSVDRIDDNVPFERYGINSIVVMKINEELERTFGPLSKTLLYEYQDIDELTGYFTKSHAEKLMELFDISGSSETRNKIDANSENPEEIDDNSLNPGNSNANSLHSDDINDNCLNPDNINSNSFNPEMEIAPYRDEKVIEALEGFTQGELTIDQLEALIEQGER